MNAYQEEIWIIQRGFKDWLSFFQDAFRSRDSFYQPKYRWDVSRVGCCNPQGDQDIRKKKI